MVKALHTSVGKGCQKSQVNSFDPQQGSHRETLFKGPPCREAWISHSRSEGGVLAALADSQLPAGSLASPPQCISWAVWFGSLN